MSTQEITKSAVKKRLYSEAVERDRRAFEIMAADKRIDFFEAMRRVMDSEERADARS